MKKRKYAKKAQNGMTTPIRQQLPSIYDPVPPSDYANLPDHPGYQVMQNQQPQQEQNPFNYGHAALAGLMGIDALIPPEKIKNPVVRPGMTYNPNQYGAAYKAGGTVYKSKSYCSGGRMKYPDGGELNKKVTIRPQLYTPFGTHSNDAMEQGWMPTSDPINGKTSYSNRYDSEFNKVLIPGSKEKGKLILTGGNNGVFDLDIQDAQGKPRQSILKGSSYDTVQQYFTNANSAIAERVRRAKAGTLPDSDQTALSHQVVGMEYGGSIDIDMDNDYYEPDAIAKSGHWIQGAINPKHKGYCTPMTKSTCTPRRKALARTFKKHHGFHKKEAGGLIPYDGTYDLEPNQIKSLLSAGYDLDFK
jgi:hypothetical protein